jgi:hypothetical protein
MANPHLLAHRQFKKGTARRMKKDPAPEDETPTFSGGGGSKTMKVVKPKGLPKKPKVHPHRAHAGARSKRAVPNKGQS